MKVYEPSLASRNTPAHSARRYSHALTATLSAVVFAPVIFYFVSGFVVGEKIQRYIGYSFLTLDTWLEFLAGSVVAGSLFLPFKKTPHWVAAISSPLIALFLINLYHIVRKL